MALSTRELFARLIQCQAGGEWRRPRSSVAYGEFARISQGGDIRRMIEQPGQFDCVRDVVGEEYNSQNVYNLDPQFTTKSSIGL